MSMWIKNHDVDLYEFASTGSGPVALVAVAENVHRPVFQVQCPCLGPPNGRMTTENVKSICCS